MSLFDIDYKILVKLITPKQLRNAKMLAWLNALIAPVKYIYNLFMTWRYEHLYILSHSPQVTYMQAMLNDFFDNALRRIIIVDGPDYEPIYIFVVPENEPVALYTITENEPDWLYTSNETIALGYDFIVQVPSSILFDDIYMSALIDKFRLVSKQHYLIQRI